MAGQKKSAKSNAQKRKSMLASRQRMSESEVSKTSQENLSQSIDNVGSQDIQGKSVPNVNGSQQASRRGSQDPMIYASKASLEPIKQVEEVKQMKNEKKGERPSEPPKKAELKLAHKDKPAQEQNPTVQDKPVHKETPSCQDELVQKQKLVQKERHEGPRAVEPPVKHAQPNDVAPVAAPSTSAVAATSVSALDASKTATCRCNIQ